MAIVSRESLYSFFETGDIPTQEEFADLIDSYVHQVEDGVYVYRPDSAIKRFGIGVAEPASRLGIAAEGAAEKLISLYTSGGINKWSVDLNPATGENNTGLNFSQETADGSISRLFIKESTGNIGVGTLNPRQKLHVEDNNPSSLTGVKVLNTATVANNGWLIGHVDDPDSSRNGGLSFQSDLDNAMERLLITGSGNIGVNEPDPQTKLHVSLPASDPNSIIALDENTGIVNVGPITGSVVLDAQGVQAREGEYIGDTLSLSTSSLHLQRLGGDIVIHGDDTIGSNRKTVITDSGSIGVGTLSPSEKLEVNGALRVGNTSTLNQGTIRWNGADFEGFDGTVWKSFTSTDAAWAEGGKGEIYHESTTSKVIIGSSPDSGGGALRAESMGETKEDSYSVLVRNTEKNISGVTKVRASLVIQNDTDWGDGSSKDIGFLVSKVNGNSTSPSNNFAAILNGNTLIGGIEDVEGSPIGEGGTHVLAMQMGKVPKLPSKLKTIQMYASDVGGTPHLSVMDGQGNVVTLAKQKAISRALSDPFPMTYDEMTVKIIDNMRQRINQLEDVLQYIGLLDK